MYRLMAFVALTLTACGPTTGNTQTSSIVAALSSGQIRVWSWQDELNVFPATLPDAAANYNADDCELYVAQIFTGNESADGATTNWIQASIANARPVAEVGMYTQTTDGTQSITLGQPASTADCESCYYTGYTYTHIVPGATSNTEQTVSQFAFFVDTKDSGGNLIRYWQSNEGTNFDFDTAFAGPPAQTSSEGDTYLAYANAASPVYWQRNVCAPPATNGM